MTVNIDNCNFEVSSIKITLNNGDNFHLSENIGNRLYVKGLDKNLSIHPIVENTIEIYSEF